jgi:hypothetical protein
MSLVIVAIAAERKSQRGIRRIEKATFLVALFHV